MVATKSYGTCGKSWLGVFTPINNSNKSIKLILRGNTNHDLGSLGKRVAGWSNLSLCGGLGGKSGCRVYSSLCGNVLCWLTVGVACLVVLLASLIPM